MKPYEVFAGHFGGNVAFNSEFIVERAGRFYMLNPRLKRLPGNFYYAGLYLGKVKRGIFFPSFNLLNLLAPGAENKVVVDRKAAWLFICGRDVFASGVLKVMGRTRKGEHTLVLNEYGECLGFGRIAAGLKGKSEEVAVKNVLDAGDFLRRERQGE